METFVVQVWRPAPGLPPGAAGLRGMVTRAATGEAVAFTSAGDLLRILGAEPAGPPAVDPPPTPVQPGSPDVTHAPAPGSGQEADGDRGDDDLRPR